MKLDQLIKNKEELSFNGNTLKYELIQEVLSQYQDQVNDLLLLKLEISSQLYSSADSQSSYEFTLQIKSEEDEYLHMVEQWKQSMNSELKVIKEIIFPFQYQFIDKQLVISIKQVNQTKTTKMFSRSSSFIEQTSLIFEGVYDFNTLFETNDETLEPKDIKVNKDQRNQVELKMDEKEVIQMKKIRFGMHNPDWEDNNVNSFIKNTKPQIFVQDLGNE